MLRRASKSKTLGVQCSDERRRAKPSGFSAPTTVEGQNPQGSVLRRASKGKTLGVQCSDDRRRVKPSGFSAPTTVEEQNPPGSRLATAFCGVNAYVRGFLADVGRPIPEGRRHVLANRDRSPSGACRSDFLSVPPPQPLVLLSLLASLHL